MWYGCRIYCEGCGQLLTASFITRRYSLRINKTFSPLSSRKPSCTADSNSNTSPVQLSTGLRVHRSFGGNTGLVIAESVRAMARLTSGTMQNIRNHTAAIRIVESEVTLENAINNLAMSSNNQRAAIPQSIAELLNAE